MKLIKVDIKNYRSIKDITVEFEPRCRVLVGINESGKSNILNALSYLQEDKIPSRADDVRECLPDEQEITDAYIRFYFRLEKQDSNTLFQSVTERVIQASPTHDIAAFNGKKISLRHVCDAVTEVRLYIDLIKQSRAHWYVTFLDGFDLSGKWVKPRKPNPYNRGNSQFSFGGQEVSLSDVSLVEESVLSETTNFEPATIADLSSLVGNAATDLLKVGGSNCIHWVYDEKNILPAEIHLDEFAANPDRYIPLRNMFWLAGIHDIREQIAAQQKRSANQMQNFLDRVARQTTSHFKGVWKEYKGIEFVLRLNGEYVIPGVKEKNAFDFSRRSDGFKRFVTFLLLISLNVKTDALKDTLLLIDEPEIGLHPTGARYLRDELIKISKKNHVVYSTHSIFMVDPGDISRHYIVKKQNEITSLDVAGTANFADEEVIYNALGYSLFENLKPINVIFEGWKDKALFKLALTASSAAIKSRFEGVGFAHAKGAKHIRSLTPLIETANRSCLVLSDSDQPAKDQQKLYRKEHGFGQWLTYQEVDASLTAVTGEDFLKNSFIYKELRKLTDEFGIEKLPVADIPATNKLATIRAGLVSRGISDDQAKDALIRLKDSLMDNVSASDIEGCYEMFVVGVANLLDAIRTQQVQE